MLYSSAAMTYNTPMSVNNIPMFSGLPNSHYPNFKISQPTLFNPNNWLYQGSFMPAPEVSSLTENQKTNANVQPKILTSGLISRGFFSNNNNVSKTHKAFDNQTTSDENILNNFE